MLNCTSSSTCPDQRDPWLAFLDNIPVMLVPVIFAILGPLFPTPSMQRFFEIEKSTASALRHFFVSLGVVGLASVLFYLLPQTKDLTAESYQLHPFVDFCLCIGFVAAYLFRNTVTELYDKSELNREDKAYMYAIHFLRCRAGLDGYVPTEEFLSERMEVAQRQTMLLALRNRQRHIASIHKTVTTPRFSGQRRPPTRVEELRQRYETRLQDKMTFAFYMLLTAAAFHALLDAFIIACQPTAERGWYMAQHVAVRRSIIAVITGMEMMSARFCGDYIVGVLATIGFLPFFASGFAFQAIHDLKEPLDSYYGLVSGISTNSSIFFLLYLELVKRWSHQKAAGYWQYLAFLVGYLIFAYSYLFVTSDF